MWHRATDTLQEYAAVSPSRCPWQTSLERGKLIRFTNTTATHDGLQRSRHDVNGTSLLNSSRAHFVRRPRDYAGYHGGGRGGRHGSGRLSSFVCRRSSFAVRVFCVLSSSFVVASGAHGARPLIDEGRRPLGGINNNAFRVHSKEKSYNASFT